MNTMEYNIRIDKELHDFLVDKKLVKEESYNSVIKRLTRITRYLRILKGGKLRW